MAASKALAPARRGLICEPVIPATVEARISPQMRRASSSSMGVQPVQWMSTPDTSAATPLDVYDPVYGTVPEPSLGGAVLRREQRVFRGCHGSQE